MSKERETTSSYNKTPHVKQRSAGRPCPLPAPASPTHPDCAPAVAPKGHIKQRASGLVKEDTTGGREEGTVEASELQTSPGQLLPGSLQEALAATRLQRLGARDGESRAWPSLPTLHLPMHNSLPAAVLQVQSETKIAREPSRSPFRIAPRLRVDRPQG
ncbi:unnamed protein product [Prorocentrum cordatum]|uniref:Uncharacterized protein n=1 Tax=Prorocentrum cordatum TaxID=2364126 RepID=A0ABN9Q1Z3_9DINO|nr:unnamed protein product [Polarella glacialis]